MKFYDAEAVRAGLTPAFADAALEEALTRGLDVEADSPRLFSGLSNGEFLLMPAGVPALGGLPAAAGVKVLTLAPDNPAAGLPRIQGTYLLFDGAALAPIAAFDGAALTLTRTPAVTAFAVTRMRGTGPIGNLLVFGTGPQALAHARFVAALAPAERISVAGRTPERAAPLVEELRADGFDAVVAGETAVEDADVIVCATSSSVPLFDGDRVKDDAVVAAIGTHGRELREVDEKLVLRADIAVEARASALREAGNLLLAASEEHWTANPPASLSDLAAGRFVRTPGRPALYSAVGMSWEDLVLANALHAGLS